MAKILKFIHAETEGVSNFGRDFLDEFPEDKTELPANESYVEAEDAPEKSLPPDPDLIRAEIMEAARYDAEDKVKEAYQEGLARGTEAGRISFDESLAQCAESLAVAGNALQEIHTAFLADMESQLVDLVKGIVTKVVGIETRINPELIQQTVRRALSLLTDEHTVTLQLNPDDLAAIQEHEVDLLASFPPIKTLKLQADEGIDPGGCIAKTDTTDVDARIPAILDQVLHDLTE